MEPVPGNSLVWISLLMEPAAGDMRASKGYRGSVTVELAGRETINVILHARLLSYNNFFEGWEV